jgi:hypothetical protein
LCKKRLPLFALEQRQPSERTLYLKSKGVMAKLIARESKKPEKPKEKGF